ncbi:MAG: type II secretion system protein [Armatimonadetes bacterium]|nr:type II secretion system protein [Armatimonadota bacterium]
MTAVRRPGYCPHRGESGFSLAEVAISVAILGILAGLAFTGPNLINNRRLAGAARALGTEVRWVIQRAQTERRCWRLVLDPANEDYDIEYLSGGTWTAGGGCSGGIWTAYTSGRPVGKSVNLVSTTFTGDVLTVSPFGAVNAGVITLQSPGGEQRRVDVNAAGRVLFTR